MTRELGIGFDQAPDALAPVTVPGVALDHVADHPPRIVGGIHLVHDPLRGLQFVQHLVRATVSPGG